MKYWTRIIGVGLMTVTLATAAHAAVGLQTIREFTLPVKPLDVALSPDGRLTFVLADNGTILVYAVDSGLKDTITVGPGIDRIAVADEGHTLVLTNSKTKQVRQVAVAFQAMIDIADSPFKGKKDAPIVLAVFSDFQCPHCVRIAPVLEQVLEHNPETVKIVFKNFPLNMHKLAMPAAQAAMAAHNQGKFWEFHNQIFATPNLAPDSFTKIATGLGLDMARFEADMKAPATQNKIMADMRNASAAEVNGTPSIFVNGWLYRGQRTPEAMQQVVDQEVTKLAATKKK